VSQTKLSEWSWRHPVVKYQVAFLILAWLAVHFILYQRFGNRLFADAVRYITKGEFLFEEATLESTTDIFYFLPIFFIGLFKWIAPEAVLPFLLFQSVVSGCAMVLLYRCIYRKYADRWAAFFAVALLLFWWDNIHWNITYMTESLFCSLVCFVICVLLSFNGSKRSWIVLTMLLILTLTTRPTGAFLVFGSLGYLLHYYWPSLEQHKFARTVTALVVLAISILGGNLILQQWDFMSDHRLGNIVTYADTLEGTPLDVAGIRADAAGLRFPPPGHSHLYDLFYFAIHNPWQFVSTGGRKLFYLLTGYRPYYSFAHNIYVLSWMSLIYTLVFLGWKRVFPSPIATFAIGVVLATCGLVMLSTVDWDNRFFIPMEPAVVLMAGLGAARMVNRLMQKVVNRLMQKVR
jgi:hypothetical protein